MARPVVIATNGIGLPVVSVEKSAPPATVADNGFGEPIVLVEANGQPMVISNLPAPT